MKTPLAAREVLLNVTGAEKADALRAAIEGPVDATAPASLSRDHPCISVVADRAAAARLRPAANRDSDHVAIVLGHREAGLSAEHAISAHSPSAVSVRGVDLRTAQTTQWDQWKRAERAPSATASASAARSTDGVRPSPAPKLAPSIA